MMIIIIIIIIIIKIIIILIILIRTYLSRITESVRKKLLSMQVLLLKTKKDKKTDNNTIYKLKKINASA